MPRFLERIRSLLNPIAKRQTIPQSPPRSDARNLAVSVPYPLEITVPCRSYQLLPRAGYSGEANVRSETCLAKHQGLHLRRRCCFLPLRRTDRKHPRQSGPSMPEWVAHCQIFGVTGQSIVFGLVSGDEVRRITMYILREPACVIF